MKIEMTVKEITEFRFSLSDRINLRREELEKYNEIKSRLSENDLKFVAMIQKHLEELIETKTKIQSILKAVSNNEEANIIVVKDEEK